MYNSIYPININYRKNNPYNAQSSNAQNSNINPDANSSKQQELPQKPFQNQINISQILTDFKNTILAINAPEDVQQDVNDYLHLVEKESKKENPSRDIILSNLRNASKISDEYIARTLGKQSNVVEGWITTIFKQNINLKANPDEINPDFLLKFPQQAQNKIQPLNVSNNQQITKEKQNETNTSIQNVNQNTEQSNKKITNTSDNIIISNSIKPQENIEVINSLELSQEIDNEQNQENFFKNDTNLNNKQNEKTPFSPLNDFDKQARKLFAQAKKLSKTNAGNADALNLLNNALGILSDSEKTEKESNDNIKAAIHLERGKIFDNYDYVDYALRDYFEATKASDLNLKAQAFYKTGNLYDEFREFSPALDNYLSSVAYSGEADNLNAQSYVLSKIASLYAKQYDEKNTANYTELAIDTAIDSENDETIAKAYSQGAQNFQYLGENKRAIENYKNALKAFSRNEESYEQMAYNYEQAAIVMEKLGNSAKARKLQERANQYYQISLQQQEQLAEAS